VGQSLQGRVLFVLRVRLQHAVAALTRVPNKHEKVLFDHMFGMHGGKISSELDTEIHCSSFKEGSFHEEDKPDRD
jgi:hypothetical protein